jgi:hypothetical protein
MHRFKFLFPALLLLLVVATGCSDKTVKIYEANLPEYQDVATWRATPIVMGSPAALQRPGKIYLYNDLLIVNELMKGVHIYNNANPAAPVDLGFLPVLANADIAVRNNIMYLDSYTDLLAFDISDPSHPRFVSRVNDAFDFTNFALLEGYDATKPAAGIDASKGVVLRWTQAKTTEDLYMSNGMPFSGGVMVDAISSSSPNVPSSIGLAGSTARFGIYDHNLYVLKNWQMTVYDIASELIKVTDITLNRSAETIFIQDNDLFIGTTTGMQVYSLANPSNPGFVSDLAHIASCDPVVVQGDKAFVTLSNGANCHTVVNSLIVVDLSNITAPYTMYDYSFTNPKGLAVDGNTLFLCDGPDGLKVFDKSDLGQINNRMISRFPGITAADVIAHNQTLIMTSAEGIFQYSYADLQNIVQVSQIAVTH